jgi:hypothetical protein
VAVAETLPDFAMSGRPLAYPETHFLKDLNSNMEYTIIGSTNRGPNLYRAPADDEFSGELLELSRVHGLPDVV